MTNIVTASFNGNNRKTITRKIYRYDYGMILKIKGLVLPNTYEVHFCNKMDSEAQTVIGNAEGVLIPNDLLLTGKDVIAYIYLHTGSDDGETVAMITIPVESRPSISDDAEQPYNPNTPIDS